MAKLDAQDLKLGVKKEKKKSGAEQPFRLVLLRCILCTIERLR
jgi:hypothetical protein